MYNALQTIQAFEAGQGQRKERERERTMQGVGNALAGGNYSGAAGLAFNMGDIGTGMQLQQYGKGLEDAEAEKKRIGLIKTGMGLLQTPLQNREAMRPQLATTLQQFGVQLDEQQLAAMDLSDEGIKATLATLQDTDSLMAQYQSMMAPPEEYTLAPGAVRYRGNEIVANNTKPIEVNGVLVDPVTFEPVADFRTPTQTGEMTPYQREQIRLEAARLGISEAQLMLEIQKAEQAAAGGTNRKIMNDPNGIPRYVDTGEPVFPGVETAPETPKPLIGAESMARVAAGLPIAKQAVTGLRSLLQNSKGTALSMEGYSPGRDFGAGLIQDVGHIPVVGGLVRPATDALSRAAGGEDYQKFEDSYSAYEAAILPIMSGAAVTDTEALRQLRAVRIKPGDSKATQERKLQAMEMQIQGLEMAARGDVSGFLGMLDQAGAITGTGPVKRSSGTPAPDEEDPEIPFLLQKYGAQ